MLEKKAAENEDGVAVERNTRSATLFTISRVVHGRTRARSTRQPGPVSILRIIIIIVTNGTYYSIFVVYLFDTKVSFEKRTSAKWISRFFFFFCFLRDYIETRKKMLRANIDSELTISSAYYIRPTDDSKRVVTVKNDTHQKFIYDN